MTRADPAVQRSDHRYSLSAGALCAGLLALLWSSPGAAAGTARASLSVGATVVETCQVSTRPDRAGAVAVSCSHDVPATLTVEQSGAVSSIRRTAAPSVSRSADPDLPAGVVRVTITY